MHEAKADAYGTANGYRDIGMIAFPSPRPKEKTKQTNKTRMSLLSEVVDVSECRTMGLRPRGSWAHPQCPKHPNLRQ
jgi:hypothetical protein